MGSATTWLERSVPVKDKYKDGQTVKWSVKVSNGKKIDSPKYRAWDQMREFRIVEEKDGSHVAISCDNKRPALAYKITYY